MMRKIRVGNDIWVRFAITLNGERVELPSIEEISVAVENISRWSEMLQPHELTATDGVVSFRIRGAETIDELDANKYLGKYRVTVSYEQLGTLHTLDAVAFELVQFSHLQGSTPHSCPELKVEFVELSGDFATGKDGEDGKSPYDIYLDGGGDPSVSEEEYYKIFIDIMDINSVIDSINGEEVGGSTMNRLLKTSEGKLGIKHAVKERGVTIPDNTPLSGYPDYIEQIKIDSIARHFVLQDVEEMGPDYNTLTNEIKNLKYLLHGNTTLKSIDCSFNSAEGDNSYFLGGAKNLEHVKLKANKITEIKSVGGNGFVAVSDPEYAKRKTLDIEINSVLSLNKIAYNHSVIENIKIVDKGAINATVIAAFCPNLAEAYLDISGVVTPSSVATSLPALTKLYLNISSSTTLFRIIGALPVLNDLTLIYDPNKIIDASFAFVNIGVPELDISLPVVETFENMVSDCRNLKKLTIRFSTTKTHLGTQIFSSCPILTDVVIMGEWKLKGSCYLENVPNLTEQSLISIGHSLLSNSGSPAQNIRMGKNLARMSDSTKLIYTNKNITLTL